MRTSLIHCDPKVRCIFLLFIELCEMLCHSSKWSGSNFQDMSAALTQWRAGLQPSKHDMHTHLVYCVFMFWSLSRLEFSGYMAIEH